MLTIWKDVYKRQTSGYPMPCSHFDTACLLTSSNSASFSWEIFFSFLICLRFSAKLKMCIRDRTCSCGAQGNTGRFCAECGKPKPSDNGWTCSCGAVNKGKFCTECGKPRPAGAKLYRCDKCGWEPEDPAHPPKFCPECGDRFDDGDVK